VTLRQLRFIAIVAPIAAVVALEIARTWLLGPVSAPVRLTLDAVAVAAILLFAVVLFRFIAVIQQRLERQNRELLALHGAGLDVAGELSLDIVLKKVVDQARALVGAKYGALSIIDAQGRIEAFITSGISDDERAAIGSPPVGHGVLGVVLHEGHSLRLRELASHPRSVGFPANHPAMRSLLAVPVPAKPHFRGNLYLADKRSGDGTFGDDDERTLERFALQAAIAIDNAQLHAQAADLAVAQERIRIAHEMHDGLAQILGYVNTKVQAANAYLSRGNTGEASQQLEQLARAARQAYTDVRESIIGLRSLPSKERAFSDALRDHIIGWKERSGVEAEVAIDPELRLRAGVELQLIRIVQEALTNVRKHAKATHVRVTIARDGEALRVTIVDDGAGFDLAARTRSDFPQFGLTTMRERAESIGGSLVIESAPAQGTTVTFSMPLVRASGD
jgi:signal transduction histidine kinase